MSQVTLFPIFLFPKPTLSCDKLTGRTPERQKDEPDRSRNVKASGNGKGRTLERIRSEKRKRDLTTNSHGKRTKYFMTKENAKNEVQTSPLKTEKHHQSVSTLDVTTQ